MARISEGTFRNWMDKDKVDATDYRREQEIIRQAINDTQDQVDSLANMNDDSLGLEEAGLLFAPLATVQDLSQRTEEAISLAGQTVTREALVAEVESKVPLVVDEKLVPVKDYLYGNRKKVKGIAVTIDDYYSTAKVDTWKDLISDVDCEIELCVVETITNSTSVDFRTYPDLLDRMTYITSSLMKPISMLKPHIGTASGGDSFYRGTYMPADMNAFFVNWTERMKFYAQICKDRNIPTLCINCEQTLQTTSAYLSKWKELIAACKAVYPELKITVAYTRYEAGRDLYEYRGMETLLDNVDIVGVNYYTSMLRSDTSKYFFGYLDSQGVQPHNDNTGFFDMDSQIAGLKTRFNKDIYVTEFGSTENADPTSSVIQPVYLGGPVDKTDQVVYMDSILDYLMGNRNIDGMFMWHIQSPFAVLTGATKDIVKKHYNQGVL